MSVISSWPATPSISTACERREDEPMKAIVFDVELDDVIQLLQLTQQDKEA